MKKSSFLQKQLFISLAVTIILVIGGFAIAFTVMRPKEDKPFVSPHVAVARLIDELAKTEPLEEVFKTLDQGTEDPNRMSTYLLDEKGDVLYATSSAPPLRLDLAKEPLPLEPYRAARPADHERFRFGTEVLKLQQTPTRYVAFQVPPRPQKRDFFRTLLTFVMISALLSALLSFAILVYYLRKNSLTVEEVIAKIHSGDLKARFPVKKLDEFGRVMVKFNEMADEIEKLVTRIKDTEKVRLDILQELGHDLRTPLASLRTMLETLSRKVGSLTDEQKSDLASTCVNEIIYLSGLVDDLLFLALVGDPRFLRNGAEVDLPALLAEEVEKFRVSHAASGKTIKLDSRLPGEFSFFADSHLLRRLIRNGLENALSFAESRVTLRAALSDNGQIAIAIEDDGPGIPPDVLAAFGIKRLNRSVHADSGQRISLGLGSVIMQAVVNAHRGKLTARNKGFYPNSGALIEIHLPART